MQTMLLWAYPFAYLQACKGRYGQVFTLRANGHPPLVFVSDPDVIRKVVTADEQILRPGDGSAAVSPIVGEHSFMLQHGTPHHNARKALLAAFGTTAIQAHAAIIEAVANQAVATWPTGTPIELHLRLRALTLEMILRVLTGRLTGSLDGSLLRLHRRVLAMLSVTSSPVLTEPYLRHGPGRRAWQTFLRDRTIVDELLLELIDAHGARPADTLLGKLAAMRNADGSKMSARQVRDNVMSVILAGHETTAAQLAWAFQLLAHHPSAQRRLATELDAAESEQYMAATIHELLRHRCVFVFAIPRALTASIDIAGYRCDPPAQLLPCIHLVHHDAASYPDPHAFVPERHLQRPPDPRTWLPWGGGRRRCPGLHLANLEIQTVLRAVLATRTVTAASSRIERPRWRGVIVAPHAGCRVVLRARRPA